MRPFFWKNKKKIPVYGMSRTIKELRRNHTFCFLKRHGYKPIMKTNIIKRKFQILKEKDKIQIEPFEVSHGEIKATGYLFDRIAYISDCNGISEKISKKLMNLDYLIIDCLRKAKHPSHFNYDDAINFIKLIKPKKAILTNLHVDLDYFELKKNLPNNIVPAFDGLTFSF
tara:strand:- start:1078 stop:1587 length:510 start_codon:yes stop_codon:yes gene_type:complete